MAEQQRSAVTIHHPRNCCAATRSRLFLRPRGVARSLFRRARTVTADKSGHYECCGPPYARALKIPFPPDASADGVEERSLVPRSRSHARLRRNATMSHAFSCVQAAFIDFPYALESKLKECKTIEPRKKAAKLDS
ncbi:hypothetical protein EVAR_30673_1 [Eumeta japonica]|uniref:Uncharacterized protein n=1 Tax=Eumeta variegata TaxID=151549 RepID=A0A4C1VTU2_EUMVA|nr:hypothetical protein EVAR_30673_1 [Eumeta japonica]